MLPSNRKENSVVPDLNILENTYIAEHCLAKKRQLIRKKNEVKKYDALKKMLWIKAQTHIDAITSLSGGNQQKVFLARWLNTEADILFDNPTQGVDVGAKVEIYRLILEFAKQGKTVIINTLEIPEIKKVSVFILTGMLVGVASFIQASKLGNVTSASSGKSYEMYAIAAVVLGGVNMAGGKGKILGVFFGALSYTTINFIIVSIPALSTDIQDTFQGLVLIAVILVQTVGPVIQEKARDMKKRRESKKQTMLNEA